MASNWHEVRLADLCESIDYGFTAAASQAEVGPKFLRITDIVGGPITWASVPFVAAEPKDRAKYRLNAGDIVIARTGATTGHSAFIKDPPDALFASYLVRLKVRDGVDPRFVAYYLKSPAFFSFIHGVMGDKSAQPNASASTMTDVRLRIPEFGVQRAISHMLGVLDDKIELNGRTNETLEAMARALFKSWFVDFDPVHAKAAGLAPMGMDAETAKLFPSEFVDSDLGPIPKGWRTQKLGELVSALSGGTPSKGNKELWDGDLPWVSPKSMTAIHADQAEDFVSAGAVGNGTRLAPTGSTLVMVRGMGLHQCVRVSQARRDVTFNQDVKALIGRTIDPTLLLFALLNSQVELLGRVESSGHGTGKLPSEILLGQRITMPPSEHQARLARVFESLNDRIAASRQESRILASIRDEMLPRLLSGALSLSASQTQVEAVA